MAYTRTVNFHKVAVVVEYEYDEGTIFKLLKATPPVDDELFDELCETVDAEHTAEEEADWRELYDGEVLGGFHDPDREKFGSDHGL